MQSEQFIIENGKKYKNRKGNFEFHSISSLKNFLNNYTESQLKEADSKAVRFVEWIDENNCTHCGWDKKGNRLLSYRHRYLTTAELFETFEQENK